MYRKYCFVAQIVLVCLIGFGLQPIQAQGDGCDPDLGDIYGILARAQVAFDSDDDPTGLTELENARVALAYIRDVCGADTESVVTAEADSDAILAAPTLRFLEIENANLRTWLAGGVYHVESFSDERLFVEWPEVQVTDFTLEWDVRVVPGHAPGVVYGLAFRGAEGFASGYYHWRIATNAQMIVYANTIHGPRGAMQGYQPRANAVDWLDVPVYRTEADAINRFKLTCSAKQCLYFINDTQVLMTTDNRLSSGGFAFVTEGNVHVVFENIRLVTSEAATVEQTTPSEAAPDIGLETAVESTITVGFANFYACGEWPAYVAFRVTNDSEQVFGSVLTTIVDVHTGAVLYNGSNNRPFTVEGGCPPGEDVLPAHETAYIAYNVSNAGTGTEAEATVQLCTLDDLQGECIVLQEIKFTKQ